MKNYLLGVLSILVIGLLSFNSIEEMLTVKPALPKSVMSVRVRGYDINATILKYTKQEYILKNISAMDESWHVTIVMEKY